MSRLSFLSNNQSIKPPKLNLLYPWNSNGTNYSHALTFPSVMKAPFFCMCVCVRSIGVQSIPQAVLHFNGNGKVRDSLLLRQLHDEWGIRSAVFSRKTSAHVISLSLRADKGNGALLQERERENGTLLTETTRT